MRIALDIDSTLHHYWDVLEAVARRRFGVALPYREQVTWEIPGLRPEQLRAAVEETHRDEHVLAAVPYPGAVETVNAWHAAGHFIHVTSHRRAEARDVTARWLEQIGMAYDELHCSYDKVGRAVELGIELMIDDSPVNLSKALEAGMTGATLVHPWNEDICEEEDIVCAPDWPTLRARLRPLLEAGAA
jgi:beta-phosphoglucomutase-like phosphatase (HAD superfamily)